MHYGQRLGRPHLLDFVMPIGIPTPYDLARTWFRRGWIRLIDQIMAERLDGLVSETWRALLV
jgi:hypothetical protein